MKLFKKLNKGFTLVELVVVIAVIAILAAVSVVAYTGITKNARKTAAISEARARYTEVYATDMLDGVLNGAEDEEVEDMLDDTVETYVVSNGSVTSYSYKCSNGYTATFTGSTGAWDADETPVNP